MKMRTYILAISLPFFLGSSPSVSNAQAPSRPIPESLLNRFLYCPIQLQDRLPEKNIEVRMDGELVPDNAVLGGTNVLGSSGLPSPRCDYEAGISITIEVPATSNDVIDSYGHCRKRGIAMKLKESIFERYKQKSGASQGSIRIMQSAPGAILGSYFARDGVCKYFPTGRIQLSLFK